MARKKTPDGRRNGISAKFSDGELAEINAARGSVPPGTWLREAALAYLRPSRRRVPEKRGQVAPPRVPPAPVSDRLPKAPPVAGGGCPHPPARINKGLCGACGTYVGKK
jgi:hypothetical protein